MRKRVLTLVLALAVCLGLCAPALAGGNGASPTYEEALNMVSLHVEPEVDKEAQRIEGSLDLRNVNGEPLDIPVIGCYQIPLDSTFQIGNISNRDDCLIFVSRMLYENDGTGVYHQVENWGGFFMKGDDLASFPARSSVSFSVESAKFAGRDLVLQICIIIGFYRQEGEPTLWPMAVTFRFDVDGEPAAQQPETPEPPAELPDVPVSATPTASTVLVNGEKKAFDAYNIAGSNYFKLRDLAYVLSGTDKQFEVGWDGGAKAISLTSGSAYTAVGGEMTGKGSGAKTATPSTAKILLDGKEISLTAYEIEGNNYFKLRDIGQTFDFGVDWDASTGTITIDTAQGYTPG